MVRSVFPDTAQDLEVVLESDAKRMLSDHRIPTTMFHVASDVGEAIRCAEKLGYPVVLKPLSPKVVHKSDVGGVMLNLLDADQVHHAFGEIMASVKHLDPDARVIIQEMVDPGLEFIIGMTTDPHFGAILLSGVGGIFTELLEDISFGLIPLKQEHAWRMLRSLRGYSVIEGYRGQAGINVEALLDIMLGVSRLVEENPQIVELDLNPVIVHEHSATVVDARMVVNRGHASDPEPVATGA